MPDMLAGDPINAGDFPASLSLSDVTNNDITSTVFITGTPVVAGTFMSPTSGRIFVEVGAGCYNLSGSGFERGYAEFEVYEGTSAGGTLVHASDNTRFRFSQGGSVGEGPYHGSRGRIVTGLTPNVTHYIRHMIARAGDTVGTTVRFTVRTLDVQAVP